MHRSLAFLTPLLLVACGNQSNLVSTAQASEKPTMTAITTRVAIHAMEDRLIRMESLLESMQKTQAKGNQDKLEFSACNKQCGADFQRNAPRDPKGKIIGDNPAWDKAYQDQEDCWTRCNDTFPIAAADTCG